MQWLATWPLAGILMMTATGCTASRAPLPEPLCQVDGDTKLLPSMTKAEICARFMAAVDAGVRDPTALAELPAGWIFRLHIHPPGVISAVLSHRDTAHIIDVEIAVSDRSLDGYAVDSLAAAVVERLAAAS